MLISISYKNNLPNNPQIPSFHVLINIYSLKGNSSATHNRSHNIQVTR